MKECNMNVIVDVELKNKAKMAALALNTTLKEFIADAIREKINKTNNERKTYGNN